jgi:hypothetical protein
MPAWHPRGSKWLPGDLPPVSHEPEPIRVLGHFEADPLRSLQAPPWGQTVEPPPLPLLPGQKRPSAPPLPLLLNAYFTSIVLVDC